MQKKYYIIIAVIILTVIIILLGWFAVLLFQSARPSQVVAPQQTIKNQRTLPVSATNASLGSQIYQKTQNPLQEKLPDTNPIKNANPIQGAYVNPF